MKLRIGCGALVLLLVMSIGWFLTVVVPVAGQETTGFVVIVSNVNAPSVHEGTNVFVTTDLATLILRDVESEAGKITKGFVEGNKILSIVVEAGPSGTHSIDIETDIMVLTPTPTATLTEKQPTEPPVITATPTITTTLPPENSTATPTPTISTTPTLTATETPTLVMTTPPEWPTKEPTVTATKKPHRDVEHTPTPTETPIATKTPVGGTVRSMFLPGTGGNHISIVYIGSALLFLGVLMIAIGCLLHRMSRD